MLLLATKQTLICHKYWLTYETPSWNAVILRFNTNKMKVMWVYLIEYTTIELRIQYFKQSLIYETEIKHICWRRSHVDSLTNKKNVQYIIDDIWCCISLHP